MLKPEIEHTTAAAAEKFLAPVEFISVRIRTRMRGAVECNKAAKLDRFGDILVNCQAGLLWFD